jgi:hypothetical protein
MRTPGDHKIVVFVADVEYIKDKFRGIFAVEPKSWKCPCNEPDCAAWVVYVRGQDQRIYFMATQTLQDGPPYPTMIIDNVEDFDIFLRSDILPPGDLFVYKQWLQQGLKEALLSA